MKRVTFAVVSLVALLALTFTAPLMARADDTPPPTGGGGCSGPDCK